MGTRTETTTTWSTRPNRVESLSREIKSECFLTHFRHMPEMALRRRKMARIWSRLLHTERKRENRNQQMTQEKTSKEDIDIIDDWKVVGKSRTWNSVIRK